MTLATRTATAALIITLAVYAGLMRASAVNTRMAEPLSGLQIASTVPDGRVLTALSLGHQEAMADLLWLNALSFYGRYFYLRNDVSWLDPHIDAITTIDPRFRLIFEWAGSVIMYGGEINNESVMAANRFLEQGIERFPFDWSLRFMLGVNYTFELQTDDEEERARWRRYGAEQIAISAGLPNAPSNLRVAAASLLRSRADWSRQIQNYYDGYLSASRTEARSIRRHIELTLPPLHAHALLRQRELTLTLSDDPRWGTRPSVFALALHPEPMYLFSPSALTPPPFAETR